MKSLFFAIPFLILSCSETNNEQSAERVESTELSEEKEAITFKSLTGQAVLIGDSIELLNDEFQPIGTLSEGTIVELMELSDSLTQKTDDYCDAFQYVKLKTKSAKGIVDGRNVYQILSTEEDTTFRYMNSHFALKTTRYFGIGVADENGLTFCYKYYEPVVLIDRATRTPKLIRVVKNSVSEKGAWKSEFPYFELMANDGAYDKIQRIEPTKNGVLLTIKREFQEGWNEFQVKLVLENGNYTAEYVNYGETNY